MNEFDMREIVLIGEHKAVRKTLEKLQESIRILLQKLNITFTMNLSSDLFYAGESEEKTLFQLLNKSKIEFRAFSPDLKKPVPISSVNFHGNHFGKVFRIRKGDKYVYSGCVAFGLQRWALIFLNYYGVNTRMWPGIGGMLIDDRL